MKDCPRCNAELPPEDLKCGACGWELVAKKQFAPVPATEDPARLAARQREADELCERLGLTTPAECRAYVLKLVKSKRANVRQREPGDDDEEIPV